MQTKIVRCSCVVALLLAGCGQGSDAELVQRSSTTSLSRSLSGPYVWWSWPSVVQQIDSDLTFSADPGSGTTYFLAHQFVIADASNNYVTGGYIGLQTLTTGIGGKGAVFSIWNGTSFTAASGSTCQQFTNEGSGIGCFHAFPWVAGKTYRLRIVNEGALGYAGYILDESTSPPTQTAIGHIQAPSGTAGFGGSSVQWLEYYGGRPSWCAQYPYIKALWSRPSGNGGAVTPSSGGTDYGAGDCKRTAIIPSGNDSYLEAGTPGTVTLRTMQAANGSYVHPASTSDGCGGGALAADGSLGPCALLTRVALPGGTVAWQTDDGYYISCASNGTISAGARTLTSAESFSETTSFGKQRYKSASGRYLTAVNGGGGDVRCDAWWAGTSEQFGESVNKAATATVTVSSESTGTGQQGTKAVDGDIDGYPGDATREWASNGELAGAWIELAWPSATSVQRVTLYDRPNTTDQVLAGTLLFSDGSSVSVGTLPNDATSGLTVSFAPKNVSWVKLRIDQAAGSNIGLAEMQVFGAP